MAKMEDLVGRGRRPRCRRCGRTIRPGEPYKRLEHVRCPEAETR